jgi:hypothetical protein
VDGVPDIENVTEALINGPYGKCVYESDNDVCDHQVLFYSFLTGAFRLTNTVFEKVVNFEFSDGTSASFTLIAYSSVICMRQTRLHFTHGEIVGDMSKFTVTDFRKSSSKTHIPPNQGGGHGGGDLGLIKAFVEAVRTGRQEVLGTDVTSVLKSHLTVFAAEHSRREGSVVDCAQFERLARARVIDGEQG